MHGLYIYRARVFGVPGPPRLAVSTVGGCSLTGNATNHNGGGIYNNGTLTVNGFSTLSSNTALEGGGIYSDVGQGKSLLVTSTTISNNTVTASASGVAMGGGIASHFERRYGIHQ